MQKSDRLVRLGERSTRHFRAQQLEEPTPKFKPRRIFDAQTRNSKVSLPKKPHNHGLICFLLAELRGVGAVDRSPRKIRKMAGPEGERLREPFVDMQQRLVVVLGCR